MKRAILLIIFIAAVVGGGVVWMKKRAEVPKPAEEKTADDEAEGPKITHDANGRVVININDETQGNMGLIVAHPEAIQMTPVLKGYGRVLDPAPLAALLIELASAQAAFTASSNELVRLKTLEGQGNASTRALQTAEAAALRDQIAIRSARDRLVLSLGTAIASQNDLPAFLQSLISQNVFVVRIDLPAGENLQSSPGGARIVTLSGNSAEADFLGPAPNVDPQTQSRGFLFQIKSNSLRLSSGEAVTGYLKVQGEPQAGVIIPRAAVIRADGAGWVYRQNSSGEAYTRIEIALNQPTEAGWFVTKNVTPNDYVVVTGAQQLLSEERKGQSAD